MNEYLTIMDPLAPYDAPVRIAERKQREDNQKFLEHLKAASKIVATWPKWKQNILGNKP